MTDLQFLNLKLYEACRSKKSHHAKWVPKIVSKNSVTSIRFILKFELCTTMYTLARPFINFDPLFSSIFSNCNLDQNFPYGGHPIGISKGGRSRTNFLVKVKIIVIKFVPSYRCRMFSLNSCSFTSCTRADVGLQ